MSQTPKTILDPSLTVKELKGGVRAYILESELEWTLARMVCHLVRELDEDFGLLLPPRRVAEILCGQGPYSVQPAVRRLDGFAILRYFSHGKVLQLIEFLQGKQIFETRQGSALTLSERGEALLDGRYLGVTGYMPVIFPMPE